MQVITDSKDLQDWASGLAGEEFITVDTEFMRERTYWSRLCLVQVSSSNSDVIIDPLANGLNLQPLLDVLADRDILKVFHAARQDIEIFYQMMKSVPQPLFDTQVAAMACGHGDQIGYEPLVKSITGHGVDKGSRFTDWSRRPLSEKQLNYAIGDVTHLRDVYLALKRELERGGRLHWVQEEMEALLDPDLYFVKPENAWKRLKLRNIKPKELGPFVKVTEWREREAQERDLPRGRILKDDSIYELARQRPTTTEGLANCRSIPNGFEGSHHAKGILAAIKAGTELSGDELPEVDRSRNLPQMPADVLDMLRVLLKKQCEHYQVAPKLIASASDLEAIARYDEPDVPSMHGWRREVFGEAALKLKAGKLGMRLTGKTIEFIDLPD